MSLCVREQVIPYLKSIPDSKLEQKLSAIAAQRSYFSFATNSTDPPNAVDSLVQGISMSQREQLEHVMVM